MLNIGQTHALLSLLEVLPSGMVDNSNLPFERAAYPLSGGLSTGDAHSDGPEAYARPCQVLLGARWLPISHPQAALTRSGGSKMAQLVKTLFRPVIRVFI